MRVGRPRRRRAALDIGAEGTSGPRLLRVPQFARRSPVRALTAPDGGDSRPDDWSSGLPSHPRRVQASVFDSLGMSFDQFFG